MGNKTSTVSYGFRSDHLFTLLHTLGKSRSSFPGHSAIVYGTRSLLRTKWRRVKTTSVLKRTFTAPGPPLPTSEAQRNSKTPANIHVRFSVFFLSTKDFQKFKLSTDRAGFATPCKSQQTAALPSLKERRR